LALVDIRQKGTARSSQMGVATAVLVFGLLITAIVMPKGEPRATFTFTAQGVGLSLLLSLALELQGGLRAMLRTDIVMLLTLFGLTLVEFLVPQREIFDFVVSPQGSADGSMAVLVGFIGLAIGRHFFPSGPAMGRVGRNLDLSSKTMFRLYLLAFLLGYLHIFLAVNFDIFEAIRQMALPRFSQDWGRGRLGAWADLLVEVGALIYLIPPLAGCIYAQAARYSTLQKLVVTAVFIFTLYYGFSSGTRNIFGVYMITFCGGYLALQPRITLRRVLSFIVPAGAITLVAMYFMLEFRNEGLGNYSFAESEFNGVFVDSNLVVISKLTEVFPRMNSYLGLEIPYNALIRPIPRAIWPGKPEGLSVGMEDALGAEGLTLASTFVGEAYMGGGILGVLLAGLIFGAAAAKWNQLGRDLSSNYKLILYVSGFFAAAIGMRSLLVVGPAILPTLALWTYGKLWLKRA
jgi:oligosaccharide repeat unit polymerase